MLEWILGTTLEWILGTTEFQNWGLNSPTIGSLGIIVFTLIEGWGLKKQNENIWENTSGESVSVTFFSFVMFFMFTFFIYGIYANSLSITINGLVLGILHVPIVAGLWKFKGFSKAEKICAAASAMMIPTMIFLPWKDAIYLVLAFTTLLAASTQPWEIWRNNKAGELSIQLLIVYLMSTIFWMVYAFSTRQLALEITTSATLVIIVITIILWSRCPKPGMEMP